MAITDLERTEAYRSEVESMMGMVPSFFAPIAGAPTVVQSLWEFAKASYLGSPIASPFKDRLFIYLSRFCEVRYCIVRHCGFLLASQPSDAEAQIADVTRLLKTVPPWQRDIDAILDTVGNWILPDGWPEPGTEAEEMLVVVAAALFVEPRRSERALAVLRQALGLARFEPLMLFLSFVRTAHYWTLVHPELLFEDDVQTLLGANGELAKLLLDDPEAGRLDMSVRLFEELRGLRDLHERQELEKAKAALEAQLRERDALVSELQDFEYELELKDERLQMALTASGAVGLWDWMVDTDLLHGDANFARIYGLDVEATRAGITMEQYQRYVVPEDIEPLRAAIRAVFERHEDFLVEYRLALPDMPVCWVECRGQMVFDKSGAPVRFSGTAVDVTARKLAEQEKQFLMQELSHRVKNTFAMVQSIVGQTMRDTDPEVTARLQDRLRALSGAHDVLLQSSWSPTNLNDLLNKVLRLNVEHDRFAISGPDMEVGPEAALSLSMLLHELATNASKYGALSVEGGRVLLEWRVADDEFRLGWSEVGGPPAKPPERRGFGSRLIGLGICGSRKADLDYGAEGLRAEFAVDSRRVILSA